jgi:hypothetical protein
MSFIPHHDLDQIQRWMQSAIMNPDGIAEGIASPQTRRLIDIGPEEAERVIKRSKSLTALERLAIYANAYYARLLECLREEFPVLKHALGEEIFDSFAAGYLELYPSRSYTLFNLGTSFPRFLAETRPDRQGQDSPAVSWPDFLIDIATLELTFSEVFDGPGIERLDLLDAAQLRMISPEALLEARLVGVPCLRLLALNYPVHHYHTAVRRNEEPDLPGPAPTWLAVTRQRFVVRHFELSRSAYELLHALLAGEKLGDAIGCALEVAGPEAEHLADHLQTWFYDWASEGFFSAVECS